MKYKRFDTQHEKHIMNWRGYVASGTRGFFLQYARFRGKE